MLFANLPCCLRVIVGLNGGLLCPLDYHLGSIYHFFLYSLSLRLTVQWYLPVCQSGFPECVTVPQVRFSVVGGPLALI